MRNRPVDDLAEDLSAREKEIAELNQFMGLIARELGDSKWNGLVDKFDQWKKEDNKRSEVLSTLKHLSESISKAIEIISFESNIVNEIGDVPCCEGDLKREPTGRRTFEMKVTWQEQYIGKEVGKGG